MYERFVLLFFFLNRVVVVVEVLSSIFLFLAMLGIRSGFGLSSGRVRSMSWVECEAKHRASIFVNKARGEIVEAYGKRESNLYSI